MTPERIDRLLREATLDNDMEVLDLLSYVRQLERHIVNVETARLQQRALLAEVVDTPPRAHDELRTLRSRIYTFLRSGEPT